jgi:hypothetical protein
MDKQYGGVKLTGSKNPPEPEYTDNGKITINNPNFKPVYNMVNRVNSNLSVLTVNSLKGFMLNLTVNENDTEYRNLDKNGKFTVPVTNFILKFVILRGTNDFTPLQSYDGIHKSFETRKSFLEEAKLQQYVWSQTIRGGSPAICPSVANFAMFDTIDSANLMWFFLEKVKTDPNTTFMFNYLYNNSKINDRGIGVLTMPAITQSTTLDRFLTLRDNTRFYETEITHEIKSHTISSVFAQIARLFIGIGVIHLDLHPGNVMIYLDPNNKLFDPKNKIKTLLIDFGRASNINDKEDDVLGQQDKADAMMLKTKLNADFFKLAEISSPNEKLKYMKSILDTIARADFSIHQPHYDDGFSYQMMWYDKYRTYYLQDNDDIRSEYAKLFVNAFDILKYMMTANIERPGISSTTINTYKRKGSLVNFNKPYVPPPNQSQRPVPVGQLEYRVNKLPQPPPNEHVSSNVNSGSFPNSVEMESITSSMEDESLDNKRSLEEINPSSPDVPVESHDTKRFRAEINPLMPPAPPKSQDDNSSLPRKSISARSSPRRSLRNFGGSKNKLHKTNKRKKGKSKRNRRNKNKNTRKKR